MVSKNDFKQAIVNIYTAHDKKITDTEWLNTNMSKYLRPITLFSNKFESYLNQGTPKNNNQLNKDVLSKIDF